ncbi:MAG: Gfo/Idh/MocA family oxidoreductase [Planctomycetota bacterium]|nr:Gfo/Idh/MocA family oxidoreductase [Planctomycetota bacterium]
MSAPASVGVGLVGAGFLAQTRARCYSNVGGVDARLVAVCSRTQEKAQAFADQHQVANTCADLDELLARDDVHLVDLCVPNHLHRPFTERAAAAGKHVACTKPLTAYVGQDLAEDASDADVSATPRAQMLELAVADAQAMVDACASAGVQLMYGENWVHAPAIRRAGELLRAGDAVALELRGWESHSGSHTPYSRLWRYNGGGALIRLAAHPIGAMIALKRAEGVARDGQPIRPVAVTAEVADLSVPAARGATPTIATGWVDVENWGCALIHFSDGTRGVAYGSDNQLGGMESKLEIMASTGHLKCNLSPHDMLRTYAASDGAFGDEYVMEKASTQAGWNYAIPNEDWSSGHLAMCADFAQAVAQGRPAASDGLLGLEVTKVIYSAYVSAAEGRRISLD